MKAAYFGLDTLQNCIELLCEREIEIVKLFSFPGDSCDSTERIRRFACKHGIPFTMEPVTQEDIRLLEQQGVTLSVTGGYPWKIPVSQSIRQINIHPSCLPVGRGPWPMPVSILRGIPSGVTLHKLSERFDEGDILLQKQIDLAEDEDLITLTEKIRVVAAELLASYLDAPDEIWAAARKQGSGEYWQEPADEERTITLTDEPARISCVLRAFRGYGVLCRVDGVLWNILDGKVTEEAGVRGCYLPLRKGYLHVLRWEPAFREITLNDRLQMEWLREQFPSALSDYSFPLLFSWQKTLELQICLTQDLCMIRSGEEYFFPMGGEARVETLLHHLLRQKGELSLRFCDERAKAFLERAFPGAEAVLSEDDCDYFAERQNLLEMPGHKMKTRRKDFHHYESLEDGPQVELITQENLRHVLELAAMVEKEDSRAERCALEHFSELGLCGILIKRGERYVSFAACSEKNSDTLQGHFMKCIDPERGATIFLMRALAQHLLEHHNYLNLEDDMGNPGLRSFKRSLQTELIPSYTVTIRKREEVNAVET